MRCILIFLLLSYSCYGMEEENKSLTVSYTQSRRNSTKDDETTRVITFFLGSKIPTLSKPITHILKDKVKHSKVPDHELWDVCSHLDPEMKLSDSQEIDEKMQEWKRMIAEAVEEVLKEKDETIVDTQLQLHLRNQEVRMEKYKLYGAIAALGGTTITSIAAIIAVLVSID